MLITYSQISFAANRRLNRTCTQFSCPKPIKETPKTEVAETNHFVVRIHEKHYSVQAKGTVHSQQLAVWDDEEN